MADGSAEPTTPLPVDRRRRAATGAAPGATPPRRGTTPEVARTAGLGAISVNADPPADIFIDGRPFGRTPFHARPIAAGRHQMVARSIDGALTRRVVIHIPDDGHVRINPFRDAHR
ncbi:MAG: hypothetical protein IT379_26965 [Deltaproteobacteria bacterium]|nr:hypothetical protein [Deltaproteobacteria bacterium]